MSNPPNGKINHKLVPLSTMPLISPNALLYALLQQTPPTRPGNRDPRQPRPIELNLSSLTHCNGSSLVRIGSTTVVCGVRAEILPVSAIPNFRVTKTTTEQDQALASSTADDLDFDGTSPLSLYNLLVPNIELATGCSENHPANTAPSTEAQSISQRLLSLLHSSNLVSLSDVEIYHHPPADADALELGLDQDPQLKAYWVLYIDMVCISYGGSIFDTAWMALYAALKDTLLPKAWWDPDDAMILCSPEMQNAKRLNLNTMPIPLSFGVFVPEKRVARKDQRGGETWLLVDLDSFEEGCCLERGCLTVDANHDQTPTIHRIEKSGGGVVDIGRIKELLPLAEQRWLEWQRLLLGPGHNTEAG